MVGGIGRLIPRSKDSAESGYGGILFLGASGGIPGGGGMGMGTFLPCNHLTFSFPMSLVTTC